MTSERLCGTYDEPDDTLRLGWEAVVSPQSVSVLFPNRHWSQMRRRDDQQPRADGQSWVTADIDGLCDAINRALRHQVSKGEAG